MATKYMLSTTDNPFNPWTEWDSWLAWDQQERHNTLALLARTAVTTDGESDELDEQARTDAIEQIVSDNFSGVHIKVAKPSDS